MGAEEDDVEALARASAIPVRLRGSEPEPIPKSGDGEREVIDEQIGADEEVEHVRNRAAVGGRC
jgi:hypothetical protein